MGDDKANEGIYRFVFARSFQPNRPSNNRRILEEGTLSIARFEPEGRRRFTTAGDTEPINATEGTGTWVPVLDSELDETATKLRARCGGGTPGGEAPDRTRPRVELLSPGRQSLSRLRTRGLAFRVRVSEPVTLTVTLRGQLTTGRSLKKLGKASARGKVRRIARGTIRVQQAGEVTLRLRPSSAMRLLLRRERVLPALLQVKAVDAARNTSTRTKQLKFK